MSTLNITLDTGAAPGADHPRRIAQALFNLAARINSGSLPPERIDHNGVIMRVAYELPRAPALEEEASPR